MREDLNQTLVFAMGSTGQEPVWLNFVPFAMVLAILYFLILLPMKKQRRKVQDFQTGLKVGDKVVTTGGIYGLITRVNDNSVQLQIADNKGPDRDGPGGGRRLSGPGAGRPGIRKRLIHGCIQKSPLEEPHHRRDRHPFRGGRSLSDSSRRVSDSRLQPG